MIMRRACWVAVVVMTACGFAQGLERQPLSDYRARRVALAAEIPNGIAVLFAAEEPVLDFMPYRQDSDFYYLTGSTEPGGALMVVAATAAEGDHPAQPYREILFLPTRNMRTEKYTGAKMDAATPDVAAITGFDEVLPMTEMPAVLNKLAVADRRRLQHVWAEKGSPQTDALMGFTAVSLGVSGLATPADAAQKVMLLRAVKSAPEVELLKKASNASIAAQFAEMKAVKPGVTEGAVAGVIVSKLLEEGCERVSYAPIVGSGKNSTTLHYSENAATMKSGDVVVIDAAGEYSMYASDITRTLPINGHFTTRQREIYDIVLGAQRAAAAAFVAGKSKINDPNHREPDSLDQVAFDYVNAHGKDLHGQLLGQYMVHGLGHLVGIDVHDPWDYSKPLEKGMVFTIEPGIYLPEEGIGVRIEDVFYVDPDGKLVDLIANLPHEAADVEAAMRQ